MHPSHLVRATRTASPCMNSLPASSTKFTPTRAKTTGNTAYRRHISTSQYSPLETCSSNSPYGPGLIKSQPFGSSSRSIATSAASESYANALATLPKSQYVPRYDRASLPRRQTLTAGENRKIDDMFSSIFNAASHQEDLTVSQNQQEASPWTTRFSTKPVPVRWTRVGDDILDQRKEEIERCESDQALYAWTLELFGELEATLAQAHLTSTPESTGQDMSESTSSEGVQEASPALPTFAYPQLLAIVMRSFRTKYQDPHTALAMFDHARNASPLSYVTCCGTAAYNELIETKWDSFRDLQGVCDALEDMKLNKVRVDTRTMRLVEGLRREVGQRNFWQEEGFGDSHSGVMSLLERIESVCWPEKDPQDRTHHITPPRQAKWTAHSEVWKRPTSSDAHDRLEFV